MLIATPCTALRILAKFYEVVCERKVFVVEEKGTDELLLVPFGTLVLCQFQRYASGEMGAIRIKPSAKCACAILQIDGLGRLFVVYSWSSVR